MQNQRNAVLAKNRDQLMGLVDSSRFKRANAVKVYKDFASVVKFIDDKGNDVDSKEGAVLTPPVLKDTVAANSEKTQPRKAEQARKAVKAQPTQKLEQATQNADQSSSASQPTDLEEKGKSRYWDTKFV